MELKEYITSALALVGGGIGWAMGGFDTAIICLMIAMGVDYVTGLIVAGVFHNSPKTDKGCLDSRVGWKGLARKFVTVLIVLVANMADVVMGTHGIRAAVCIGFFANECLSIVENAGHMGLRIPKVLSEAIEELTHKGEEMDTEHHGGISNVLGDRRNKENSFGLVSLCSVGPVLAVLLLGVFSRSDLSYTIPDYSVSSDVLGAFLHTAGHTCREVAIALGLIIAFFMICQVMFLKLSRRQLSRIAVGVVFTFLGLVIFLTGVNVGFMPIGYKLGYELSDIGSPFLIGFGIVVGILVVLAEPAIHVLNTQVEEVTGGLVTKRSMMVGLCVGVGTSIGLSMIRIAYDFSLVYYVIPGYFISLALSLFVPPVYTAIAFDSGGVASGPMTSGFILPFAIGACVAMQGADAVLRDAFGVVALVAMTPLITIQLLGFRGIIAERRAERRAMKRILDADDQQIINFL